LGTASTGALVIQRRETQSNVHIIGAPKQGKSTLTEGLIRQDVGKDCVCFVDGTSLGKTAHNVFRWCAYQGYENVIYIDVKRILESKRVPCIQPFNYKPIYKTTTVAHVMDTLRVLYNMKDMSHYLCVEQYLPAILRLLWNAQVTLNEALYFTDKDNAIFRFYREQIFRKSSEQDHDRINVSGAFKNHTAYREFGSTVRRILPLFHPVLRLIFGVREGINFDDLITKKYVILINGYPGLGLEPIHAKLLGVAVINELIFSAERLIEEGWKGRIRLYIDEAGRFMNDKLVDLLEHQRHLGFHTTLAHQSFFQFTEKGYSEAVKNLCTTKIMFHTQDYYDRLEMVKALGYGGDIPHQLATYVNRNLPTQEAVVARYKGDPLRMTALDVKEVGEEYLSKQAEKEFLAKTFKLRGFYHPDEIVKQWEHRFNVQPSSRKNTRSPSGGATPNRKTGGKDDPPPRKSAFS